MYIEEIKRGLRGEIKKRENEQYWTCETNIRQMCKDVLAKIEEQESMLAEKDKELRRQKYKRCMAMANACRSEMRYWHIRYNIAAGYDRSYEKNKHKLLIKWRNRWLAIAEKFKTNSSAQ